MKMRPTDYESLRAALRALVAAHRDALTAHRSKVSERRFLWDVLHASRFDTHELYRYLDDSHIETALRHIMRELLP